MQKLLFLLAGVALITSAFFIFHHESRPKKIAESNMPLEIVAEWIEWKQTYGKDYAEESIEAYRMEIFFKNFLFIQAHNDQNLEWKMAINQFADLDNAEWKATYLGYKKIDNREKNYAGLENLPQAPPTSWNWAQQPNKVTPVKNQGQCGDCYAFSSTGALESDSAIFGSGLQSFSEQQLCDCSTSYGNNGCNGGLMDYCFKYVIANGITTEQAYPYTGVQGQCKVNGGAFKISSYTDVTPNNCSQLTQAVYQQPTSVAVDAQTWQFYSSGVFSLCGNQVDHGVLAVGYTPTYWIVKNSWGTTWGQQGYIELKVGNTCAICSEPSFPNL